MRVIPLTRVFISVFCTSHFVFLSNLFCVTFEHLAAGHRKISASVVLVNVSWRCTSYKIYIYTYDLVIVRRILYSLFFLIYFFWRMSVWSFLLFFMSCHFSEARQQSIIKLIVCASLSHTDTPIHSRTFADSFAKREAGKNEEKRTTCLPFWVFLRLDKQQKFSHLWQNIPFLFHLFNPFFCLLLVFSLTQHKMYANRHFVLRFWGPK